MKAKTFFTLFIVMAGIPLMLAFAVLKMGWFTPGATNKGEFVSFDASINFDHATPKWSVVYQPGSRCDSVCDEQLYALNQTYIALGKLQKRVNAYVLGNVNETKFPKLQSVNQQNGNLLANHLYIVDPFGKVIMQYQGSADRQQTIKTSKDILADLKKLLKYARVG